MKKHTSKKQISLHPSEKNQTSLSKKLLMNKKIMLGGLEFEITKIVDQKGKSVKKIDLEWRQNVRVPLRQCDYTEPLKARKYPFQSDSHEDELSYGLAASIVLNAPFWRRFRHWPGRRAIPAAYAELRRLLLKYGYDPKDLEKCSIADIAELLSEGNCQAESKGLLESELLKRGYSGPLPSDKCLAHFAGHSIDEIVETIAIAKKGETTIDLTAEKTVGLKLTEASDDKPKGRKRKYTSNLLQLVEATFDECHDNGMDIKGAWSKAAETHGIKSGKAAEMACRRYLNKQNKQNK